MDVTEHPTGDGKIYLAVVLEAFSRMVVGWAIGDHMRAELVVDALQMAIWRRQPSPGRTVAHADHGAQYTSWAFGRRLRAAGLLGSMGSIGDCFDNPVVEASSAPCNSSSSTSGLGTTVSNSRWASSSGSNVGTTPAAATATAACSAPPTTKPPTPPPLTRHDHLTQPVRRNGGSSQDLIGLADADLAAHPADVLAPAPVRRARR